jgi:hypothetical protein
MDPISVEFLPDDGARMMWNRPGKFITAAALTFIAAVTPRETMAQSAGTRYLSDTAWTSATNGWGPAEKNMSNGEASAGDGRTITLNGKTYAKGLGVHAGSEVRFNLGGSCSAFTSDLGVDDEVGSNGSVVFQVWGDGLKLYDSGMLYGYSTTQQAKVDITGKSQLSLVVTDAGNGNAFDHADWASAQVTCSGAVQNPGTTPTTVLTQTLRITSADNGKTFSNYRISTTSGDCIEIIGAANVTIENSNIGPCGTNNSKSPSRGVYVHAGSKAINLYDNYIHVENLASGCCDSHNGVFLDTVSGITIQGNVIAYGETNIESSWSNGITVTGNFLLNPRGPFPRGQNFQSGGAGAGNLTIQNNYMLSSVDTNKYLYPEVQEDSVNIGTKTDGYVIQNNYITGGHSGSGCGAISDDGANHGKFLNNILLNTGQCGIGIASGTNQVIGNRVLNTTPVPGAGNTGMGVWAANSPCGPTTVDGNTSTEVRTDGYSSGYWNGGGCNPVSCLNGSTSIDGCNTFDYGAGRTAYNKLRQDAAMTAPPLIPPAPKTCVAKSPYSTQTSLPGCK